MTSSSTSESSATSSTWVTGQGWVGDSNTYPDQKKAAEFVVVATARCSLAAIECAYAANKVPHVAQTYAARSALRNLQQSGVGQPADDNMVAIHRRCCRIIGYLEGRERPYQDEVDLGVTLEAYIAPPPDAETS